jgi:hypothetical protein
MSTRAPEQVITRFADRSASRTEAMVQADVRALLLTAPLGLDDEHVVRTPDSHRPSGERPSRQTALAGAS